MHANAVKNAIDAMEAAVSAVLAFKGLDVPPGHKARVLRLIDSLNLADDEDITIILIKWIAKRETSRYVDIVGGEVKVPHQIFDEVDAEEAIADTRKVIVFAKDVVKTEKL